MAKRPQANTHKMEKAITNICLYGYGTCNFYRQSTKLGEKAKEKGLINLENKRFIDSSSYFTWLKENNSSGFAENHELCPIIWIETGDEKKELIGGCTEFHKYMKEKYNFGSGECNATCGLTGLTWKTLGRKDKGRIIIASAIFALFLIMALLMIIIGLDKHYRFYLYIPLSVSFVVGGQVLAL